MKIFFIYCDRDILYNIFIIDNSYLKIELEFRTFTESGLLLYSQQHVDGSGDFLSLTLIDGFVEFRYNLGSGPAIIRSHHKVTPKKFHRVSIMLLLFNIY